MFPAIRNRGGCGEGKVPEELSSYCLLRVNAKGHGSTHQSRLAFLGIVLSSPSGGVPLPCARASQHGSTGFWRLIKKLRPASAVVKRPVETVTARGSNDASRGPSDKAIGPSGKTIEASDKTIEASDKTIEPSGKTIGPSDKAIEASDKAIEASDKAIEPSDKAIGPSDKATGRCDT